MTVDHERRIAELEMEVRYWKALAMVSLQKAAEAMTIEAQKVGEPFAAQHSETEKP